MIRLTQSHLHTEFFGANVLRRPAESVIAAFLSALKARRPKCFQSNLSAREGAAMLTALVILVALSQTAAAKTMASSDTATCSIGHDGGIRCWGSNRWGEMGTGTTVESPLPTAVTGIHDAIALTAGSRQFCAVLQTGKVRCWGHNFRSALGTGDPREIIPTPMEVIGVDRAVDVTTHSESGSCAVIADGTARCWGELGNPDRTAREVMGVTQTSSVQIAAAGACALSSTGKVRCWGDNSFGQLGNGNYNSSVVISDVLGIFDAIQLVGGDYGYCARLVVGTVKCWGAILDLGGWFGPSVTSATPVAMDGITDARSIAAGPHHTCAVAGSGRVKCWGLNESGQLGSGAPLNSAIPVDVADVYDARSVHVGESHSCSVAANGTARCWGNNVNGSLGNGRFSLTAAALPVAGITNVRDMVLDQYSCAADTRDAVYCWGGSLGTLAAGHGPYLTSPVRVMNAGDVVELSSQADHSCALDSVDGIRCWGRNTYGELGTSSIDWLSIGAVSAPPIPRAHSISSGLGHSCVIADGRVHCWGRTEDGEAGPVDLISLAAVQAAGQSSCALGNGGKVFCWGLNHQGQLGNGSTTVIIRTPVEVEGISDATQISGSWYNYCSRHPDGRIRCWGDNRSGQIGNGTTNMDGQATPAPVSNVATAVKVVVGLEFACAIINNGGIRCWGNNEAGQLGDGSRVNRPLAISVTGISGARSLGLGDWHACAALADGSVWCWGSGIYGQLGNRKLGISDVPVRVIGISNAIGVTAGSRHSCALLADRSVKCWGDRYYTGDGSNAANTLPQRIVGSPFSDNFVPLPTGLTGLWYDPATSGQGLRLEVLDEHRLSFAFTGFSEAGERIALMGVHEHTEGAVIGKPMRIPVYQTRGRGFSQFDPASVNRTWWGEAVLTFLDCSNALLSTTGLDGTQTLDLKQLSRPAGLICSDD